MRAALVSTFLVVWLSAAAQAVGSEAKALLSRVMWSAFQCSRLAGMSGKPEESDRLFSAGFKAGREFLEALSSGRISPDILRSTVPIGVTLHLGGPSIDFMIGRVYEAAISDAYDSIVKRDRGLPLGSRDWVTDDALKKSRASNQYLESNCALIR